MINFNEVTEKVSKNISKLTTSFWSSVDIIHNWRFWIRKKNSLFNLINQPLDIDKISLHARGPYEAIYQFLINKRESTDFNDFNGSKAFIVYSDVLHDIYKNTEEYNPNKKLKALVIFNDMNADKPNSKKPNPVVTQQTFVSLQDVLNTSSKHTLKTPQHLQHLFSVTIFCLLRHAKTYWRRLEDLLKTTRATSWKTKKLLHWRRPQDPLQICLKDVLKTCVEDLFNMSFRQTKFLLGISVI